MIFNIIGYNNVIDGRSRPIALNNFRDCLYYIDIVVDEVLQKFNVPGIAIGVIANNKVILSRGYGTRNMKKKLPVTENTLFPIASCTKAFTALLLAQLVEEKLISWDDPVIAYVPEFRLLNAGISREITLRDLCAHRTGVPRHDLIWLSKQISRSEVLACLEHLEPICQLREHYYYNNFMYSVAGIVIERITGQSWEEAVHSRILAPLKMSSSGTCSEQLCRKSDFSLPYAEIDGVIETLSFYHFDAIAPGGGINSNIIDMLKWVQMQLMGEEQTVVQRDSLEEMHSIQIPFHQMDASFGISQLGYGLGWAIGNYGDHRVISHSGWIDGFISEVSLLPKENIGIVILSNSSTDGSYAIVTIRNAILDRLLGTCTTNWIELVQTKRDKAKTLLKAEENQELKVPPRSLQDYVGNYEHPAYGSVRIYVDKNKLVASYGKSLINLSYSQNNIFQGQIREYLIFGIKRITDFTFCDNASKRIHEVQINFEPDAKPLVFKRK